MKKLLFLFAVVTLISACNRGQEKSAAKAEEVSTVTVSQILADPAALLDKQVSVTGMVTHVCKHGGQKLFIIDTDPEQQVRVNVGEGIPEFDVALEGSTVTFKGVFKKLTPEEQTAMQGDNKEMHEEEHANPEAHAAAEEAEYFIEAVSFEQVPSAQ